MLRVELMQNAPPERIWRRGKPIPSIATQQIVDRWNEIRRDQGLAPSWTKEKGYRQVRDIVGESEYVHIKYLRCRFLILCSS